jgi:hypothetical protein
MNNSNDNHTSCWWCGSPADSREHIFKKTDIKRTYGKAFSDKNNLPLLISGSTNTYKIQGPDAQPVKFKANLCQNCNNARSSSFDRAYVKFIEHISPLFQEILSTREINLKEIFGDSWKEETRNLIKYYIKHIGCRLANEKIPTPENLVRFLNDEEELKDVKLQFEVRPLNKAISEISFDTGVPFEVLKVGNLLTVNVAREKAQLSRSYLSWITTGWLSVNYLIESDVSRSNLAIFNSNHKLSVKVANLELPSGFEDQKNIYEKTNLIEDYDRSCSNEAIQKFYFRLKEQEI